jgi:chaperonin GroES
MIKPLRDRVVLEPAEASNKTASGIYLPDSAQKKPQEGTVIAVGPGKTLENGTVQPMTLKVGDQVLYGKWSGTEVQFDGKDFVLMTEDDVLGVIEKETANV